MTNWYENDKTTQKKRSYKKERKLTRKKNKMKFKACIAPTIRTDLNSMSVSEFKTCIVLFQPNNCI